MRLGSCSWPGYQFQVRMYTCTEISSLYYINNVCVIWADGWH